eukprot:1160087-Pelagomonas_calceolata.AAC.8
MKGKLMLPFIPFCYMWVGLSTPLTLDPLQNLGLDTHKATKPVLKLHAHSVQYACKLVSTKHAFEKASFNSYQQQDQAWDTASNPPDPN